MTHEAFEEASRLFVALQPRIGEAKEALKALRKESSGHIKVVRAYMEQNELTEMDVSGFTFASEEKESCRWSEDNLLTILDEEVLEKYKEEFTETKRSFKIKPPKRAKKNAEE